MNEEKQSPESIPRKRVPLDQPPSAGVQRLLDVPPAQIVALNAILMERKQQDERWGEQNHTPLEWLAILTEEVGELAKEVHEAHFKEVQKPTACDETYVSHMLAVDTKKYREELVQVAAVALSMLECLERGKWRDR